MSTQKSILNKCIRTLILLFVLLNVVAVFHSYTFTHFTNRFIEKTEDPKKLTIGEKIHTLVFGIDNPRPENNDKPSVHYETVTLNSNKQIECWECKTKSTKGTIILFHGYRGQKSSMLDKESIFRNQGYNTLLVDFMGSGGSEGNQTTIGYTEAQQVKTCYDYLVEKGEQNIYLMGTSMGAVAIMKAINDFNIQPKGIILECPFGSMYETVCARFQTMHVPIFPMAGLLVFWGGVQNGFWAFGHNPTKYAKNINCSTLLLYGAKDEKVSSTEIDQIFANLNGPKKLRIYPEAAHENYLTKYPDEWKHDVTDFLYQSSNMY